jgi:hypothetical protein
MTRTPRGGHGTRGVLVAGPLQVSDEVKQPDLETPSTSMTAIGGEDDALARSARLAPSAPHNAFRPRKRPAKLHLDKAYDYPRCRRALRRRGITPRIARRGIESSQRLGRHRYLVERSLAWLVGHRRLQVRYERRADVLIGFAYLACALICLKALNASRSFPTPDRMTMPGHHPDQRAPSHKADACLHWLSSAASEDLEAQDLALSEGEEHAHPRLVPQLAGLPPAPLDVGEHQHSVARVECLLAHHLGQVVLLGRSPFGEAPGHVQPWLDPPKRVELHLRVDEREEPGKILLVHRVGEALHDRQILLRYLIAQYPHCLVVRQGARLKPRNQPKVGNML